MAQAYARLIMNGNKTIEDVPERLREAVLEILKEAGYELPENDA